MWWRHHKQNSIREKTTKSNQYYYWVYKWLTINLTSKPIEITGGCTTSMWWYNTEIINALKQLKRGKNYEIKIWNLIFLDDRKSSLPVILRLSLVLGLICAFVGIPQCQSILYLYGGKVLATSPGPLILQLSLVNTLFW